MWTARFNALGGRHNRLQHQIQVVSGLYSTGSDKVYRGDAHSRSGTRNVHQFLASKIQKVHISFWYQELALAPSRAVFYSVLVSASRKQIVQESMTHAQETCASFWLQVLHRYKSSNSYIQQN